MIINPNNNNIIATAHVWLEIIRKYEPKPKPKPKTNTVKRPIYNVALASSFNYNNNNIK